MKQYKNRLNSNITKQHKSFFNTISSYIVTNRRTLLIMTLFAIVIYQWNRNSNLSKMLNFEINKNKSISKELDQQIQIVNFLHDKIKDLEDRFNNESSITEQYTRMQLRKLVLQKYSGHVSYNYPNGLKYVAGTLIQGSERGLWTYYDSTGKINTMYDYPLVCVGSLCCDGSLSRSVGRGTCSWHGGVCSILYEYQRRYLK